MCADINGQQWKGLEVYVYDMIGGVESIAEIGGNIGK